MGVKNHSGIITRIETWANSSGQLEMKLFGDPGFLWHFAEDGATDRIEKGRFYAPIYKKHTDRRTEIRSNHLFYILRESDEDDETVFVELGSNGYVNPTAQPADRMNNEVENRDLLPMWLVSTFGGRPEETISLLEKLA